LCTSVETNSIFYFQRFRSIALIKIATKKTRQGWLRSIGVGDLLFSASEFDARGHSYDDRAADLNRWRALR